MTRLFLYPLKNNSFRIIDGDTVEVLLDKGFADQKTVSLRFLGLNAPESKTRNKLEKEAGLLVKKVVKHWLDERKTGKIFYITSDEKPKYAGRTIGRFWASSIPDSFKEDCLNDYLLKKEVVKPYTGGKRQFTGEELQKIIDNCKKLLSL